MTELQTRAQDLRAEATTLERTAIRLRRTADELDGCRQNRRGPVLAGRAILKERGLQYRVVANELGYSQRTLENVLSGSTESKPLLNKLAAYLGVSVDAVSRPLEQHSA